MLRPSACAIFVASANTFITTRSPGPVRLEPGAISSLSTCASILICATLAPIVRPCEEHLSHPPPEGPLQDGGPGGHRWTGADRSVTIAMTLCRTVLASSRGFLSTIRNSTAVKISDTRPPADSQPGAARVAVSNMTDTHIAPSIGFTPSERAYIRTELDIFFSTLPTVAEGFLLKTWRGGPDRGKPKLSPVAKGLLDRGLMRLDTSERLPRLVFTETGIDALRAMMSDRRLADPKKFAHIRQELGIDPMPETEAPHA